MRKENLKRKGIDDGDVSGEENDGPEDSTLPAGGGEGEGSGAAAEATGEDSAETVADSVSPDGKDDEGTGAGAADPETATGENGDSKDAGSDNDEQFEDAESGDKVKENGDQSADDGGVIVGEGDKKVSRGRPPKKAIAKELAANGDADNEKKENGGGKSSDSGEEGENGEDEDEEEEAEGDDKDDDDSDYGSSPKKAKKAAAGKRGAKKKVTKKPAAGKARGRPGRKPKKQESEDEGEEEEEEEEYEVQDIIDHRKERGGKIVYRIRWKNYGAADDTWEPEATLSCPDIIKKYKAKCEKDEGAPAAKKGKTPTKSPAAKKGTPGRKPAPAAAGRGRGRPGGKKPKYDDEAEDDGDESETEAEYEVERIIDVHFKRNGAKEYLVRWKGFTAKDDTWEPADNLSCPDLIEKFNEKLDKTKSSGVKELRVNRKHTERLTLVEKGRKTSRRNANKGRVNYYDGE